jgi:hypothetical protein
MPIGVNVPEHMKKKFKKEIPDPNKLRGWKTPDGFFDFTHPVTYEEALEQGKQIKELFISMVIKSKIGENQ